MPNKNKITTLGYFIKRLKDNGYIVWKIMDRYDHDTDYRKWTVLINPSQESVMVTCLLNREGLNELPCFDFYDGGLCKGPMTAFALSLLCRNVFLIPSADPLALKQVMRFNKHVAMML